MVQLSHFTLHNVQFYYNIDMCDYIHPPKIQHYIQVNSFIETKHNVKNDIITGNMQYMFDSIIKTYVYACTIQDFIKLLLSLN